MRKPRTSGADPLQMLPPLPGWVSLAGPESLEEAAFVSGAALAHLALASANPALPQALWRDRLALRAAEVCAGFAGRREGQAGLRDALHLARPGDDPGPAGRILRQWSQVVARPISVAGLDRALVDVPAETIALCLDAVGGTPVDRAARVLEAVLSDHPRGEVPALVLADAVLSKATGREHLVPLLSQALKPRDLRLKGEDLQLACHRAVAAGVRQALSLAGELARGAARFQAIAPKLRAKTAARALEMFLTRDALAPAALTFMSDRAARRLCDRLVDLGAIRELTGRDTFRLYGV